jgi:N-methylhydantoinase A
MIRVEGKKITEVGPRSAHIAGLAYEVFSPVLNNPHLELVAPCADDEQVFAAVEGSDGQRVALTLAGAANVLGKVPEGDYAAGNREAARVAWQALGMVLGVSAEEAARQAMDIGIGKVRQVVEGLVHDYELPLNGLVLAGGGGSAGVVTPYLGEKMGCQWKLVKNAPVISTIGVALAMVREIVERTVVNPTDEDIRSIRRAALEQIMKSGAKEATVEIAIEIDKQSNILRAIAMGATELRTQDLSGKLPTPEELRTIAAQSMELPMKSVQEIAAAGKWHVFEGRLEKRSFLFFKKAEFRLRVLDRDGIIRLRKIAQAVLATTKEKLTEDLHDLVETNTEYGTIGGQLPLLYVFYGEKQIDLSGLVSMEQIEALLKLELDGLKPNEKLLIVAAK